MSLTLLLLALMVIYLRGLAVLIADAARAVRSEVNAAPAIREGAASGA